MRIPINVAVLYSGFLDFGGVETQLLSLFQHGDKDRFRWLVFGTASQEFSFKAQKHGVDVLPWNNFTRLDFRGLLQLVQLLKTYNITLIHIHDPRSFIVGQLSASLLCLKTLYTVHIPLYDYVAGQGRFAKIKRFLYLEFSKRYIYRFADHVSFVSRRVYEETIKWGLSPAWKISLIHNGINLELFNFSIGKKTERKQRNIPINRKIICFVGRLNHQKGIDILLDAIGILVLTQADFFVWIVGEGEERDFLQKKVGIIGLGSKVSFLGLRQDVNKILQSADIFVLPSRYEGMPLAILEAMAAGLPIIATDTGDNSFLIADGLTGFVVPPNNAVILAKKLQILLNDPLLRKSMGEAGQHKISLHTDVSMVSKIEAVYDALMSDSLS